MLTNSLSKYFRCVNTIGITRNWCIRTLSAEALAQVKVEEKHEVEWKNAKPYSSIPGPSKLQMITMFMPGGDLYNLEFLQMYKVMYKKFGPLQIFRGFFGRRDVVFTFKPEDIEMIYRTDGKYPVRRGMDTFDYYRTHYRPEVYGNNSGLINEQGEGWYKLRSVINPIMLKPKIIKGYIPYIDDMSKDFIIRMKKLRDDKNEMPDDFLNEMRKWSLESIGFIALEHRLGILRDGEGTEENQKLIDAVQDTFSLSFELDYQPSIWKYYKTAKFHKLMAAMDVMTDISIKHIDNALKRFQNTENTENTDNRQDSVLRKLLEVNKDYAIVMAVDMLKAGANTTASAAAGLLFNLANNQRVQSKLREEVMTVLPSDPNATLTPESLNSLPYLRACLKESLRLVPGSSGNVRTSGRDLVLQGYQIPKDTDLIMATVTAGQNEENVERASEFIPERMLKEVDASCPVSNDIHPFLTLQFGFGARGCIGRRIAEMTIEVLIIRLLREFKFEWNYGPLTFKNSLVVVPVTNLKYKVTNL